MSGFMRLLIALLAPALLLQHDRVAAAQFCEERWRCAFQHTDASSRVWRWDLSTLCREGGTWSYGPNAQTVGQVFNFNVCGNTSSVCSDYANTKAQYESHGVATQLLQVQRGVRTNGGCLRPDNSTCKDWTFGGTTCCSERRCEVVALSAFTFDVVDPLNSATGGVRLTHSGYPDTDNDDIACPFQESGLRRLRQFILTLDCDPTGTVDNLEVTGYNENSPYCAFRVRAKSAAACGVADPSPSSSPSRTPTASSSSSAAASLQPIAPAVAAGAGPGAQFGLVVLGAVLCGAVQVALAWGGTRALKALTIVTEYRKTPLSASALPKLPSRAESDALPLLRAGAAVRL